MKSTTSGLLAVLVLASAAAAQAQVQMLQPLPKPYVGTAHPTERYTAAWCKEPECHFTVKVELPCKITVDPQWMGVRRKQRAVLVWHLVAPAGEGFTFAADKAVPFKPESELGAKEEFEEERRSKNDTLVQRLDKNTKAGAYHYKIRIYRKGKYCGEIDPPIINEM